MGLSKQEKATIAPSNLKMVAESINARISEYNELVSILHLSLDNVCTRPSRIGNESEMIEIAGFADEMISRANIIGDLNSSLRIAIERLNNFIG